MMVYWLLHNWQCKTRIVAQPEDKEISECKRVLQGGGGGGVGDQSSLFHLHVKIPKRTYWLITIELKIKIQHFNVTTLRKTNYFSEREVIDVQK